MRFGIAPRGMRSPQSPASMCRVAQSGGSALFHAAVERLILPVRDMFDQAVFDGIEMNVIHVRGIVAFIAHGVFPDAALPDAALAAAGG